MTKYAKIEDGEIVKVGRPGGAERKSETGEWLMPYDGVWTPADLTLVGWAEIIEDPAPTFDPEAERVSVKVELIDGVPHQTQTVEALSLEEARRARRLLRKRRERRLTRASVRALEEHADTLAALSGADLIQAIADMQVQLAKIVSALIEDDPDE